MTVDSEAEWVLRKGKKRMFLNIIISTTYIFIGMYLRGHDGQWDDNILCELILISELQGKERHAGFIADNDILRFETSMPGQQLKTDFRLDSSDYRFILQLC